MAAHRSLFSLARWVVIAVVLACTGQTTAALPRLSGPPASTSPSQATPAGALFIENVGQFDPSARFHLLGGDGLAWIAEDGLWLTVWSSESGVLSQESEVPNPQSPIPSPQSPIPNPQSPIPSPQSPIPDPFPPLPARQGVHLRISFPDANPQPRLQPFGRYTARLSYFYGNDPSGWRPDVPVWSGVRYVELYPGVDLEISAGESGWAWQFVVRSGQFPVDQIALRIEGAETLALDGDQLAIATGAGPARLNLPALAGRERSWLPPAAVVGDRVMAPFAARVAPSGSGAQPRQPDTAAGSSDLRYGVYLGGIEQENAYAIALGSDNSAYIAGPANAPGLPVSPGAFDGAWAGKWDVLVARFSPDASQLLYATFLGGGENDIGYDLAVDGAGNAHITGGSASPDFPITPGVVGPVFKGSVTFPVEDPYDGFVTALNPTGTGLIYSTYLAGDEKDQGRGIDVDSGGAVYVAGVTYSNDFPVTPGGYDRTCGSTDTPCTVREGNLTTLIADGFALKLDATATALLYGTFLGGEETDAAYGVAVDDQANAAVVGVTRSSDFALALGTGGHPVVESDAFVLKLTPDGSGLVLGTGNILGGRGDDVAYAVAVGVGAARRDLYVTGSTDSSDFPTTTGAFATRRGGPRDAFVARIFPGWIRASTYLGGTGVETGYGIGIDGAGDVYVSGYTHYGSGFPISPHAFDGVLNGSDAFVVHLDGLLSQMVYATFLGGMGENVAYDLALDGEGAVYVTGYSETNDFPATPGAFDTTFNGGTDVTVAKLLAQGYTLGGQVVDATGNPLVKVKLEGTFGLQATSDLSGTYRFTGLGSGRYTITPTTPGFFWSPPSQTLSLPPSAPGVNFVGSNLRKTSSLPAWQPLAVGDPLTYTVQIVLPASGVRSFSDPLPGMGELIGGSLAAPAGIVYDPAAHAVTGTVSLTGYSPLTLSYSVQITQSGTLTAPLTLVNRACLRLYGSDLDGCQWSNGVWNFAPAWPQFLPQVSR